VSERQVRFTEQFFDRLDVLLPGERGNDGTPSITDFLLLDLPRVRDRLVWDYQGNTLATEDPDVRVHIGAGLLVSRYAIFVAEEGDVIEAFWFLSIWIVVSTSRRTFVCDRRSNRRTTILKKRVQTPPITLYRTGRKSATLPAQCSGPSSNSCYRFAWSSKASSMDDA
jgi:hypothetical protein